MLNSERGLSYSSEKTLANSPLRLKLCLMSDDISYNHNNPIGQVLIILIFICNIA